jgi:pilus assembly protein CpaB
MADRRYSLIFYVAVLVAAAATYGVYRVLEAAKVRNQVTTQPVVVALTDLPEGASIERTAVGTNMWPVQAVPAGAFAAVDSVVGRVTRVAVFRGEPIVPGRLAPPGTGPGLEVKITPGKRAMALKINDVAGISGLIQPNSRVDVLVTIRDAITKSDRQVAKLFMENMRVLSVGTQVQRGEDGRPISATTATLEVTPEEAEQLAIAANQGSIQLVLRGYGDPDSVVTAGATSVDVLKQLREAEAQLARPPQPRPRRTERPAPPPPVVVERPRQPDSLTVKIYRGGRLSQEKFDTTSSGSTP